MQTSKQHICKTTHNIQTTEKHITKTQKNTSSYTEAPTNKSKRKTQGKNKTHKTAQNTETT